MHTAASDGQGCVADKYACAAARGLKEIAICDHGFGSILLHSTRRKFDVQNGDILKAAAMKSVTVRQSIEASVVNDAGDIDVPDDIIARCDVLHLGFHRLMQFGYIRRAPQFMLVNGWGTKSARLDEDLVEYNTRAFSNALRRYPVDVLCHLNHRAQVDVKRIAEVALERGVYIELNEKHIETMESAIGILLESGVTFILGSDAHRTAQTGLFPRVTEFIKRYGIPEERICGVGAEPRFKPKKNKTEV